MRQAFDSHTSAAFTELQRAMVKVYRACWDLQAVLMLTASTISARVADSC